MIHDDGSSTLTMQLGADRYILRAAMVRPRVFRVVLLRESSNAVLEHLTHTINADDSDQACRRYRDKLFIDGVLLTK